MPLYEVVHVCKLSDTQQDQLAEAITEIHSKKFTTPRLFVNVIFTDGNARTTFVAGKRRKYNAIVGNVRHGPSRTDADYSDLCSQITAAWEKIVGSEGEDDLRAIFILGGLIAAQEAGFSMPPAGQDAAWVKENYGGFKKMADSGNEDFQELVRDIHSRPEFKAMAAAAA